METVSISDLKAKLSRYLDAVRGGDEIVVTDRGRPIARLTPVTGAENLDARMQWLVREGRVRPPRRADSIDLERLRRPADPEGRSLAALLEERRAGR